MEINKTNFAYGLILTEQEGVDRARAVQLALVAGLMGPSILAAAVVQKIARDEVAAAPPPEEPARPNPVEVPDIPRLTPSKEAEGTLQAVGLVAVLKPTTSEQEPGLVIGQSPAGGTIVEEGSEVTLNVSVKRSPRG